MQIAGGFLDSAPVDLAGMADHLGLFVKEKMISRQIYLE
jgi:hypothetical protein